MEDTSRTVVTRRETTDLDVLLGRGLLVMRHPGNVYFREQIQVRIVSYMEGTNRRNKHLLAVQVYNAILTRGGRFLRKVTTLSKDDRGEELWEGVTYEEAISKIKQAFRDNSSEENLANAQRDDSTARVNTNDGVSSTSIIPQVGTLQPVFAPVLPQATTNSSDMARLLLLPSQNQTLGVPLVGPPINQISYGVIDQMQHMLTSMLTSILQQQQMATVPHTSTIMNQPGTAQQLIAQDDDSHAFDEAEVAVRRARLHREEREEKAPDEKPPSKRRRTSK